MRLIDANEIIYERLIIEKDTPVQKYRMRANVVLKNDVNNMPTIEAIPIEWLINKCNEADNMGMGIDDWSVKDCYQLVLEAWEEENEK